MKKLYLIFLLTFILTACTNDYNFSYIEIGDSQSDVIAIMGEPNKIETVEIPLGIMAERLTWKNKLTGAVYQADFLVGKLVDKQIQKRKVF